MKMGSQIMTPAPVHGVKRAAVDDLEREQRLSKRFDLLNLGSNGSKLYIPVLSDREEPDDTAKAHEPNRNDGQIRSLQNDGMEVEDTPNRIYINDLDAEIASLEPSSPTHPIFIPDIEKHLLGLPSAVLKASPEEETLRREREKAMQMVVYGVPTSLTVSEDEDNVRRAIEDARRRVRQRMPLGQYSSSSTAQSAASCDSHNSQNDDMMDET